MKKSILGKAIAIFIVIAVVITGALLVKPTHATVDCTECSGYGYTHAFSCADCDGYGYTHTLDCTDCSGKGKIENNDCTTCDGEGEVVVKGKLKGTVPEDSKSKCEKCEGKGTTKITGVLDSETLQTSKVSCKECKGTGTVAPSSNYYSTLMALLPPLVAIALALITKEVYSSLFIGIALGGFLAANWNPVAALDHIMNKGIIAATSGTAGIFIFLVILGIMVALVNRAGGSAAFGRWAETHIKSRTGAILASFILGVLIFIDDYFNCLTVGSVMLPITDRHKISRAKLAYVIDATAAPVCMIAPVSSWAAAVSEFAEGTGYSGIELFIRAIPYNFYSLLTFVFIIGITLLNFDYGPMKLHEYNAKVKGDLFTSGKEEAAVEKEYENPKGKVIDLVLPILVLVAICVIGLVYVGEFFEGKTLIEAFENTDATVGLPWGSLVALLLTAIYLMARRLITFKDAMNCIPKGFIAMVPAILILTFATSLKNMTDLLGAKYFVAGIMDSAAAGLANFLPAIIFLVACLLSFSTGTSWGTFGILIPIVTAIFDPGELLIIGMSASLAGAVCGDHCSPISDTTIMASAGSRSNHLNHVSTQLPYAITVAAISFVCYLVAAFIQNAWIILPIGIVITLGTLFMIKAISTKKA